MAPLAPEERGSLAFLGPGRLGCALAEAADGAGYDTVLWGRRRSSWRSTANLPSDRQFVGDLPSILSSAQAIFLTTDDQALPELADRLARSGLLRAGQFVFHCSGVETADVLDPARAAGPEVGSVHPLQAVTATRRSFRGIYFSVEGDQAAVAWGEFFVRALGGYPVRLSTAVKDLYHAAASLASNGLVSLVGAAEALLVEAGIARTEAAQMLLPLLTGTLENLEDTAPTGALTGPVARGDVATVRRHLSVLTARAPHLLSLYRELARAALPLARAQGLAPVSRLGEIEALLSVKAPVGGEPQNG